MVAVFESGKGDLYENMRDLLLFNRRRSAEKAVQQAKSSGPRAWSGKQRAEGSNPFRPFSFYKCQIYSRVLCISVDGSYYIFAQR